MTRIPKDPYGYGGVDKYEAASIGPTEGELTAYERELQRRQTAGEFANWIGDQLSEDVSAWERVGSSALRMTRNGKTFLVVVVEADE